MKPQAIPRRRADVLRAQRRRRLRVDLKAAIADAMPRDLEGVLGFLFGLTATVLTLVCFAGMMTGADSLSDLWGKL